MRAFTSILPTRASFLALSPRQLAGAVLELMNASGDERAHLKTLRNDVEQDYGAASSQALAAKLFAALALLMDEGYTFRDFKDAVAPIGLRSPRKNARSHTVRRSTALRHDSLLRSTLTDLPAGGAVGSYQHPLRLRHAVTLHARKSAPTPSIVCKELDYDPAHGGIASVSFTEREKKQARERQRPRRQRLRDVRPSVTVNIPPNLSLKTASDCVAALELAASMIDREPFKAQTLIATVRVISGLVQPRRLEHVLAGSDFEGMLGRASSALGRSPGRAS